MTLFENILDHLGFQQDPTPPRAVPESTLNFDNPVLKQDETHPCPAYTELKLRFRDVGRMNAIIEILGRDFLTAMPYGAYQSRLGQIAFLYRRMHEDLTGDAIHDLLNEAQNHSYQKSESWDEWDQANLREMRDLYLMYSHVPPELMERKARLSYEGRNRHRDILQSGDWQQAKTFLSEQIEIHQEIAAARCEASGTSSAYEKLMQEYMPGMSIQQVESLFDAHDAALKKLLPEIVEKQAREGDPLTFEGMRFDPVAQMWLNRAMLSVIGFDFERGGLYETGHNPVEGGTVDDTRLVITNVDQRNFLHSLKSAMHEGGHGLYIQGLPRKTWRYQPVAMDMSAAVHESQALLYEMIIGRTSEFFEFLAPRLEGLFHGIHDPALSAENLRNLKTRVKPTADRKKADEVTYFYHVLLRFRLERDLIDGSLKIDDLPEAWVEGLHSLLGVTPDNNIGGCLQDVHWFVGKFGYFPAYAIGHMMAAQIYEAVRGAIPSTLELIRQGEFSQITGWLQENIYSRGRLMNMQDLMKEATGQTLRASYLEKHLRRRYLLS